MSIISCTFIFRSIVIFQSQHSPDLATCTSGKAMVRGKRQNVEFCCYFLQTCIGSHHPREVIYGLTMLIITRDCCGITWYNHKTLRRLTQITIQIHRALRFYIGTLNNSTAREFDSPKVGLCIFEAWKISVFNSWKQRPKDGKFRFWWQMLANGSS